MSPGEARHIYCIGIGGIGISGLAKIFFAQGKKVSGVDAVRSEITDELAFMGMQIKIGEADAVIPPFVDLLIYSEAVPFPHPLRRAARDRDIPELSGAEALAWLSRNKYTIAVAGTNGKSTTTALLGLILADAGRDPTIFIGSRTQLLPMQNVRLGMSDLLVLEADEYQEKLLHYRPHIALITNLELDHLDTYRDLQHLSETFDNFLGKIHRDGFCFINKDDSGSQKLHPHGNVITYSTKQDANYRAVNLRSTNQKQIFRILGEGGIDLGEFSLQIPGRFNVANALGAAAVAFTLGAKPDSVRATLAAFPGLWRRFEQVGTIGANPDAPRVISDYGHHPTAVAKTIAAAREFFPGNRIVLVYQPHQVHRTRALFADFVKTLPTADLVLVSDIYDVAGRDDQFMPVSSKQLVDAIAKPHVRYAGDLAATEAMTRSLVRPGDVIIIMGAGTIDKIARHLCLSS